MSSETSGGTHRRVEITVGLIFAAIIVASVALALYAPVSLPPQSTAQTSQTNQAPYVLVIVYQLSSTTFTTTVTTTPQPHVYVVIEPIVIVVVNSSQTYTITTTTTTTSTSYG